MCSPPRSSRSPAGDRGAATTEFVLVAVLVIAIALGVLQLALALHVRNTLASCAAAGARAAAVASLAEGADRAESCARDALGVSASATAVHAGTVTLPVVRLTLEAPPPSVALWRPGAVEVEARALVEGADDAP